MAYQYYQGLPGYGTPNYQLMAPPVPAYQPLPSWTGQDYYRAHYGGADGYYDDAIYPDIWSRFRNWISGGVGFEEARNYHRRIYGGMVDITRVSPTELGAAAGFEVFRLWDSHSSVYRSSVMDDSRREREALAGMAIAEATKLWSYLSRPDDTHSRRQMCETAAGTAERIRRRTSRYEYDSSPYDSDDNPEYGDNSYYHLYRRNRYRGNRRFPSNSSSSSYNSLALTNSSSYYPTANSLALSRYNPTAGLAPQYVPQYQQQLPMVQSYPGTQYMYGNGMYGNGMGMAVPPGYSLGYPQAQMPTQMPMQMPMQPMMQPMMPTMGMGMGMGMGMPGMQQPYMRPRAYSTVGW